MKTVLTLCAGLVVGGLGVWVVSSMIGGGDPAAPGADSSETGNAGSAQLLDGSEPVISAAARGESDAPSPSGGDPAGAEVVGASPAAGGSVGIVPTPLFTDEPMPEIPTPFDRSSSPDGTGRVETAGGAPVLAGELERQRQLARATFDAGEPGYGGQLLEVVYLKWKDDPQVDLVPEVSRLLRVEQSFNARREYLQYIARRADAAQVFEGQFRRALEKLAGARQSSAAALTAWEELSLAYEAAPGQAERRLVLAKLTPFIDDMVFSGRATLITDSYTVQPGDNLSGIAKRNRTTVGAIRRLNRLASDVIRPRQRLRLLPGEVVVHVKKAEFRLWVAVDGKFLFERAVGLGKGGGTPEGEFVVKIREKDPTWWQPGKPPIPAGDPANVLGSRWLGFEETENHAGYGIHGTTDPSSIGRESSAGCVRMLNADVELLYDFVPYGGRVEITG